MKLDWKCKTFNELTTQELYDLLRLRQEVFIIEQDCNYLDADGKDLRAKHVLGYFKNGLVAYARILAPGVSYKEVSIGRILTAKQARRTGAGLALLKYALQEIEQHYGEVDVRISAQTYLLEFYEKFGFKSTGKSYLEDNLPHTEMLRSS